MLFALALQIKKTTIQNIVADTKTYRDYVVLFLDSKEKEPTEYIKYLSSLESKYKNLLFVSVDRQDNDSASVYTAAGIESTPCLAVVKESEGGPEFLFAPTINNTVQFIDVKLKTATESVYVVESELDLLDNYEFMRRQDSIVFFAGHNCSTCAESKLNVLKLAKDKEMNVYLVNCDENAVLEQLCARRQIRNFPWVQILRKGWFSDYVAEDREIPNYFNVLAAFDKPPKAEETGEVFTEEWMDAHKTQFKDGAPLEWPVKPNLKELKETVKTLEKKVAELEKEATKLSK
ncbi:Conserved_hypothetical protein [Hexamita inflata]|uniref:Thioredoxin domain-containing protein n=1 Tax=Hexamita inflata TaxID=28002 RepID=A0ABP1K245_9EUKA